MKYLPIAETRRQRPKARCELLLSHPCIVCQRDAELKELAGTWSAEDLQEFEAAFERLSQVEPHIWDQLLGGLILECQSRYASDLERRCRQAVGTSSLALMSELDAFSVDL